jgi:hypothetical protein
VICAGIIREAELANAIYSARVATVAARFVKQHAEPVMVIDPFLAARALSLRHVIHGPRPYQKRSLERTSKIL